MAIISKKRANSVGVSSSVSPNEILTNASVNVNTSDDSGKGQLKPEIQSKKLASKTIKNAKEPELYEMLENFDWNVSGNATALEERLLNEMQALESANVHALIQSAEPAKTLRQQIDKSIVELESVDIWLSSYTEMLDMMGQDVQEIEAKNKDLQLVSDNQKLLLEELQMLMNALQLPQWITDALSASRFDTNNGIVKCEEAASALLKLLEYKFPEPLDQMVAVKERLAMFTRHGSEFAAKLCQFLHNRLQVQSEQILSTILSLESKRQRGGDGLSTSLEQLHATTSGHEALHSVLVPYTSLISLSNQFDTRQKFELQMDYAASMNKIIAKELQYFIENTKTHIWAKKPKESELTYLFTQALSGASTQLTSTLWTMVSSSAANSGSASNQPGADRGSTLAINSGASHGHQRHGSLYNSTIDTTEAYMAQVRGTNALASADRKISHISVVFSVTSWFRPPSSISGLGAYDSGTLEPADKLGSDELFMFILDFLLPVVNAEREYLQNTLTLMPSNFKDVKVYSRLKELLDVVFDTLPTELTGLVHKFSKVDATLCISMAVKVEKLLDTYSSVPTEESAESNAVAPEESLDKSVLNLASTPASKEQAKQPVTNLKGSFVCSILDKCLRKIQSILDSFVNDQIKAILDPALSLRKRNGILIIVDTVPAFIDRVEFQLSCWTGRTMAEYVSKMYARIAQAVFDSLAKMSESSELLVSGDSASREIGHKRGASTFIGISKEYSGASAEDAPSNTTQQKALLHWNVLMVQNMHFFGMSVRARKVKAFEPWLKLARSLYEENLRKYTFSVTRRPFGKMYEFFDGIETLLASGHSHDEVSFHAQFSRQNVRDILMKFPTKDFRESLRALFKRVEKHFNEQDGLLQVVWHSVSETLLKDIRRFEELLAKCYPNSGLQLDFNTIHLLSFLSEMAQEI